MVIEVDKLTRLWYRVVDFVIFPIHKCSLYHQSRLIEYIIIKIYDVSRIFFSHQNLKKKQLRWQHIIAASRGWKKRLQKKTYLLQINKIFK